MMDLIFNKIIDIYKPTWVPPDPLMGGDGHWDWDNPTLVASVPASVQPLKSDEQIIYKDPGTISTFKVFCRKVDVQDFYQVKLLDLNPNYWQVIGMPWDWNYQGTHIEYVRFVIQQVSYDG